MIYICDDCSFSCTKNADFNRHLLTKKHYKKIMIFNCDDCHISCTRKIDFNRHLLTKKHAKNIKTNNSNNHVTNYDDDNNNDEQIKFSNEVIIKLLKDNEEMKKIIIEQTQQQKQIMEMLPKMCIGNIITTNTTNNIKQKFNLNFFLNEQCKDAINMCDFVKSLNITFDDLNVTRDKSLEDSVGSIFLRGLKELDVFKRPIHCTDVKRDVMYIKEEDNWKKDEGNEKLKNSISEISKKQVKTLKELKDSDPEIKTNENKRDEFILTMNHVCTPIPDSGEKRIIKTISKEVIVA
jgi:ribosomal protein L35